ncbi:MAG: hypothetical protein FJZ59_01325 [Chlamydiae bacterium]|jgi:hypothetical protein|nr:hypothetical protein [Chlamydiota bacterium]
MKKMYVISLGVLALSICNASVGGVEKNIAQVNGSFLASMLADSQDPQAPTQDDGTTPNTPAGRAGKPKTPASDGSSQGDGTSTEEEVDSEED